MPFAHPWTDQAPDDLVRGTVQQSWAYVDNPASLRVSEKLGYRRDGANTWARRGVAVTEIRLVLAAKELVRPEWTLDVAGLDGCRELLGAV